MVYSGKRSLEAQRRRKQRFFEKKDNDVRLLNAIPRRYDAFPQKKFMVQSSHQLMDKAFRDSLRLQHPFRID